jgi:choline-glycine betaine transporter
MLQKIRQWGQTFIYLDLMFTMTWFVVCAVFALIFLVIVLIRGQNEMIIPLLIPLVVILTILGLAHWVARDARKASKALRYERRRRKPGPDGDMSDVAGIPKRPPWMG